MPSIKETALRLVLKARDTLSRPVKQSADSLESLRSTAQSLKSQLTELEKQGKLLSSFQKQTTAVRDAGKAYREAEANVEQLAREYRQTEKPTKTLERQLTGARKAVIAANQSYDKQRAKLAELRGSLTEAGLSNRNLAQQQQRVSNELNETSAAYQKANTKAKAAGKTFRNSGLKKTARDAERASGSLSRLSQRFAGLVSAGLGLYAIKRGIEGILSTGDKFERLNVQLEAIMGSMEGGEQALAWIKAFTRNTPFQLEEVSEAFVRLKAFGLDPMDGSMQAVVDQASKLGGGMERLNGISLAVGQAWAKQKLQGEEILQLVERGVPVWEMLEKVTGKNVQELQKLSEQGKLGRDTIRLLLEEIGRSADGAAAKNMSLLSGYVSNLKDSWQNFLDEIANSGALEYTKNLLADLSDQIGVMASDGRLSALAKSISDGFIQMAESVRVSLSSLTIEGTVASLKQGFETISGILGSLRTAFQLTGNTIKFFFNGFTVLVKGFATAFLATVSEIIFGWQKIFEVIGADTLASKLESSVNYLRSLSAAYAKATAEDANDARDALVGMVETFAVKHEQVQNKVRTENKVTAQQLKQEQERYREEVEKTATTAQAAFADAADALKQINAAETRTELADLGVALAQAFADGTLTQEQYNEALEVSRQKLNQLKSEAGETGDSLKDVGEAGEQAGQQQAAGFAEAQSIAAAMAGHYNSLSAELEGMSGAAHDAFLSMQGVGSVDTEAAQGDLSDLKNELQGAKEQAQQLSQAVSFDPTGITRWMNETGANAAYVKAQFLEQKVALEELLASYESGEISARQMARAGQNAADSMTLLNEQDLDRLNSSIEQAKSGMESLNDSARSTLDNLQNELDQLQGKNEQIEKRQFENRQRELEAQLDEAKTGGDAESVKSLQQALALNRKIYQEKRFQKAQEKRDEQKYSQQQRSTSAPTLPARQANSSPEKVIRLEYPSGSVNVGINRSDESKLLEALKNAGMRTL